MGVTIGDTISVITMIILSIFGCTVAWKTIKRGNFDLGDKFFFGWIIFYLLYTLYHIGAYVWEVVQ